MTGASNIIIYVPPTLFSIVALAFLCLWRSGFISSWHWSAGFAQTALGFVLSTFSVDPMFDAFSSGMVFMGAAYCYGSGLLTHFEGPRLQLARRSLVLIYTPTLAWLVFVEQSLVWQLFLTDVGFALLLGIAVLAVARRASRPIDIALVAASVIVVLDSILRTAFFTFFTDSSNDLGDFAASAYNLAVHVSTITVCMIFPFTALGAIGSAAIERHRSDAERDHLTGLPNRRGFEKGLERQFGEGVPQGIALLFDIDRFKRINDTYGHAVGDRAIIMLGDVLRQTVGASGYVARAGGEEFIAFLPEACESDGMDIANAVRMSFETLGWSGLGMDHVVTVSGGLASVGDEPHGIEHAFRSADEALYMAKSSGRNRIVSERLLVSGRGKPGLPSLSRMPADDYALGHKSDQVAAG